MNNKTSVFSSASLRQFCTLILGAVAWVFQSAPSATAQTTIIVDNTDTVGVTITGVWDASTSVSGFQGSNYLHDKKQGKGTKSVRYTPSIVNAGSYEVHVRYTSGTNRASNVPIDITHAGGVDHVLIDQRTGGGQWVLLGTYQFAAGSNGSVLISNTGTNGYVIADAVRFTQVGAPPPPPPGNLTITLNSAGLETLVYAGHNFVRNTNGSTPITPQGQFRPDFSLVRPDQTVYTNLYSESSTWTRQFDAANQRVTMTYAWGNASCTYTVNGDELNMRIAIHNLHPTDTVRGYGIQLNDFFFPGGSTPSGWGASNPPSVDNSETPSVIYGRIVNSNPELSMVAVNKDATTEQITRFAPKYWNGFRFRTETNTNFPGIPPGGSRVFDIAIRFGSVNATAMDLASDIYAAFRAQYPMAYSWPDRRPIGVDFLGGGGEPHPESNPRGWFNNDSTVNVLTPEGVAAFHTRILNRANTLVTNLNRMGAQGCIAWDVEGWQYNSVTYVGDPRLVPTFAPEMDGVVDQYFSILRNAGFRVGVTVRPQQVTQGQMNPYIQVDLPNDAARFTELNSKIQYARNRWNCTLFYIDSSVGKGPLYEALVAANPGVLLMPEFGNVRTYASTALYKEMRGGFRGTADQVLNTYPDAFSVINVFDGNDTQWNDARAALLQAVQRGDLLLFQAWWWPTRNGQVKALYDEAFPNGFPPEWTNPPTPVDIIMDNSDASGITITGTWPTSTFVSGYYGTNYIHDQNTGKGSKSVRYTPNLPAAGSYEVFIRYVADTSRANNVPVDITHSGGTSTVTVNQRINGGTWVSLGTYNFAAGTGGNVLIRTTGTNGYVIADAVRFVKP